MMCLLKYLYIHILAVVNKTAKKDSSSSDSSDDSDDESKKAAAKPVVTNGAAKKNRKSSSEDSSDSDDEAPAKKAKVVVNNSGAGKKQDSSSDSSESEEEETKPVAKTPAKLAPTKTSTPHNFKPVAFVSGGFAKPAAEEESSDSDSGEEEKAKAAPVQTNGTAGKKRKFSASEHNESPVAKKANHNNSFNTSSNSKPNTPFRRVKTEEIEVDDRLANNSFDAKVSRPIF